MSLTDRHRAVLMFRNVQVFNGLVCVSIRCLQRALRMRIVDDVKRVRITLKLRERLLQQCQYKAIKPTESHPIIKHHSYQYGSCIHQRQGRYTETRLSDKRINDQND